MECFDVTRLPVGRRGKVGGQGHDSVSRQEKMAAVWPGCHNLNETEIQDLHSSERFRGTRVSLFLQV